MEIIIKIGGFALASPELSDERAGLASHLQPIRPPCLIARVAVWDRLAGHPGRTRLSSGVGPTATERGDNEYS